MLAPNWTFDFCFKVVLGYHTKKALYLPYYWSLGFEQGYAIPLFTSSSKLEMYALHTLHTDVR